MKIALLHGAKYNAGDYLIKNRCIDLIKHYYPDCTITEYYRNQDLSPCFEEINSHDILIFAGGPGYVNGFYPDLVPLSSDLDDIKIPMMIIGMGSFCYTDLPSYIYNYHFTPEMITLLKRVENDTKTLGCRDYITSSILRNNGFDSVSMTGCPAWYDLKYIGQEIYTGPKLSQIKNICISDPANPAHLPAFLELIRYIHAFFNESRIKVLFHRGVTKDNLAIINQLSNTNIELVDISNSYNGLSLYDDCELHIGFRVHAHLYNLSQRHLSILIEEDARGHGANQALCLPRITANTFGSAKDFSLIKYAVEDFILNLNDENYLLMNNAFHSMNEHYKIMEKHIESIEKYI